MDKTQTFFKLGTQRIRLKEPQHFNTFMQREGLEKTASEEGPTAALLRYLECFPENVQLVDEDGGPL